MLQKIVAFVYTRLLGNEIDQEVKEYFLKGSFASFSISIGSAVLAMLIGFVLAKVLGADGYGTYTYIFSWVMLLSILSSFGIDDLAVRELSKYQGNDDRHSIKVFLKWSVIVVLALSVVVPLLSFGVFNFITLPGIEGYESLFFIALLAVPLIALTHLGQGQLRGLSKVIPGKVPEKIIRPTLLLVFIAVIIYGSNSLSLREAVIGNTVAFLVALLACMVYLSKHTKEFFGKPSSHNGSHQLIWMRSAPFFFFLSAIEIINSRADILMLGMMTDSTNVGVYSIAARLVDLIPFVLMVINPVLAPVFSKLYHSNNTKKLEVIYRKSARLTFFMALPVFILLAVFGNWILSLFGPEFTPGYYVLIILGVSQLFNAFTGSVGNMLMMSGYEKETLTSYGASIILNIALNLWLIPLYGIYGAAIATAVSLFVSNLLMSIFVFKRIGVSPLGKFTTQD